MTSRIHVLLISLTVVLFSSSFSSTTAIISFQRVTDPNGTEVCALESPTVIYEIDELSLPLLSNTYTCNYSIVLCSWKCSLELNCTAFNWKSLRRECELYFFVPVTCEAKPHCEHYGSKICRSCLGEVLNVTGDNEIKGVFINGCESGSLPNAASFRNADSLSLPLMVDLIAVKVGNAAGVGGLLGSTSSLCTDGTWRVSTNYTPGWMDLNYDDSGWENATTLASNDGLSTWPAIQEINRGAFWISSTRKSEPEFYFRYNAKRGTT